MTCVGEESSALQQRAALVYGIGGSLGHGDVFGGKGLEKLFGWVRGRRRRGRRLAKRIMMIVGGDVGDVLGRVDEAM